jgi:DnaK suppressor protein
MSEALTKQQLQILGRDLVALKASLNQLLVDTEAATKPVNLKDNQGRLSRMDEMHNQSILLANRNVTKNRLRSVISAQRRFELSQFGECSECGEDIAFSRLKAYPEADMCILCQQQHESSTQQT